MRFDQFLEEYNRLNNSFIRKLVFRLGYDGGFFSEYNNMVFAILFCLNKRIKFTLSSINNNFSEVGWVEYFEEFCPEDFDKFHIKHNTRQYSRPSIRQQIKRYLHILSTKTYLTQDLWLKFHNTKFEKKTFKIDQLAINSDFFGACKYIIKLTWRYNTETLEKINRIIYKINLPKKYLAVHIRKGDKFKESGIIPSETYINKLKKSSTIKDYFVLTDDYEVITELNLLFPELTFYHLTDSEGKGYDHNLFSHLNSSTKKDALLKLFASIEIMSAAQFSMCTFSSNVGLFLGMRNGISNTFDVEGNELHIW